MTAVRSSRVSRFVVLGRRLLLVISAILGLIWFRRAYLLLRDAGAAFWALSLLYCFIAAFCWIVTIGFLRTGRPPDKKEQEDEGKRSDA